MMLLSNRCAGPEYCRYTSSSSANARDSPSRASMSGMSLSYKASAHPFQRIWCSLPSGWEDCRQVDASIRCRSSEPSLGSARCSLGNHRSVSFDSPARSMHLKSSQLQMCRVYSMAEPTRSRRRMQCIVLVCGLKTCKKAWRPI